MTLQSTIIEMIEELKTSDEITKVRLVSWPFSRKLVEAICEYREFQYDYIRLDKRFEVFAIYTEDTFEDSLKKMIKLINKEARQFEKFTKQRNVLVDTIIQELGISENNDSDEISEDESAEVIEENVEDEIEEQVESEQHDFGCPECESTEFTENGKFNDMQKYKCKNCGHNFTEKSAVKFDAL